MNDYTEMRKRLEGMTEQDFDSVIGDFYDAGLIEDGEALWELNGKSGETRLLAPSENWRQDWTQKILAYKRTKPEEWDRVCSGLGITEDSIRTMNLAQQANRFSFFALLIALFALLVAGAANLQYLGKLLSWLKSL